MTPTADSGCQAAVILERVYALLDEDRLGEQIDEPIDVATRHFNIPDFPDISHHQFLGTVATFLQYLYARVFPYGRQLSPAQARDEAVALLDQAHGGEVFQGYEDALIVATDPDQPGLALVLVEVAELLKARHREMYLRCVVADHIDSADWLTKCAMAALLLDRLRRSFPARQCALTPERMAHRIVDLLKLELRTRIHPPSTIGAFDDLFN